MELGEMSIQYKILAMVPIVNVCVAERMYYGRLSRVGIMTGGMIGLLMARFAVIFLAPTVSWIQIVTTILLLAAVMICFAGNAILVFSILNDADVFGLGKKLVYSLFFPIGQYYIGAYLPNVVSKIKDTEEVF
jgi:hypothetical protein